MLFNPKDKESVQKSAIVYAECLAGEELFEIVRKGRRTLSQNSYLHLLLSYLASQLGYKMEYVKTEYYKKLVNPYIYIYEFYDRVQDKVVSGLRSSKDLTKEEMMISIERLKIWSAEEAGIVLPDAEDKQAIQQAQIEVDKAKLWI